MDAPHTTDMADTADTTDMAAEKALTALAARGEKLAVAESLTGGMVAAAFTRVPGASQVFTGSVTAYTTEIKRTLLSVDAELLATKGAVAAGVARQMATGVRNLLGTDWGVATTGVAGPQEQDGKAVGTVFVAVAGPHAKRPIAQRLFLPGERGDIQRGSVLAALELLLGELVDEHGLDDTKMGGGR